jgi:hypothetical protein
MSRPMTDRVFDLAGIVEAHRRMEAAGQVGKLVVTVPLSRGRSRDGG